MSMNVAPSQAAPAPKVSALGTGRTGHMAPSPGVTCPCRIQRLKNELRIELGDLRFTPVSLSHNPPTIPPGPQGNADMHTTAAKLRTQAITNHHQ